MNIPLTTIFLAIGLGATAFLLFFALYRFSWWIAQNKRDKE